MKYNDQMLNTPQEQQTPQAPYNPFDEGVAKAISSARSNFGMTQNQQHGAINNAILNFGNAISQEPVVKGWRENFGVFGRAMNPALNAYNTAESAAEKENNALAQQILAHKEHERQVQAQQEEKLWNRQQKEREFGALQQYRQAKLMQDQAKLASQFGYNPDLPEGSIPITNKQERTMYVKDRKALGTILKEFEELENSYDTFRKSTKGNIFDPLSPIGSYANWAKGGIGRFAGIKSLREEEAQRLGLKARLNKFVTTSERALKGGGVLGPTIIKMFKEQGIYPDIEHDSPETIAEKMASIKEELNTNYLASDLSLKNNIHINPYEVDKYSSDFGNSQAVEMVDPYGEVYHIPKNEVQEAINSGLSETHYE
ncbi:hypothetical protein UFOVP1311_16 [uncultured Caudovirales phage]|uniref:Uncharacterized protein n=1 Tax=uncultured Caudovirales phage TaxID=2100421 RepID=A0A6J5RT43_9CAUD|nr:hypothetical protein UFOVP1311_16 [uncultured Caudovirales phage]